MILGKQRVRSLNTEQYTELYMYMSADTEPKNDANCRKWRARWVRRQK
jgi:hypothetical protein